MKNRIHIRSMLTLLALAFLLPTNIAYAVNQGSELRDITSLNDGPWKLAPQTEVKKSGEQLSLPGYADASWLKAKVPGTAFADYLAAGKEEEPSYGENAYLIDLTKYDLNYWYRSEFEVPAEYFKGGITWLNLDGVIRDAEVFVNGSKVGGMKGFMQRGRFNVTDLLKKNGKNVLAVLVRMPVLSTEKGTGNACTPTLLCSRGWDWMPRVPGLNTGLTKDVYLTHTGEVTLIDPWVRTEGLKQNNTRADLSVQVEVANHAASPITGKLTGEINPGNIPFSQSVSLKPNEVQTVTFNATNTPSLQIQNPKLWWPNGYGDPNLYTANLKFQVDGKTSDQKQVSFGIRKYGYETVNKILRFSINGVPLFLKGGSWGPPEFLLRKRSAADYETWLRFHREQNFNVIRNWMGATPDEEFYRACDRNGLLVWDEFWLDSHGGATFDLPVFFANAEEKIRQLRNHPSIALWCAMNEGTPPPQVSDPLREIVRKVDGDDRKYIPNSARGDDRIGGDKSDNNLSGSGPWGDLALKQYFLGVMTKRGVEMPFGLRSELGMATVPNIESVKKFIPKENLWPVVTTVNNSMRIEPVWKKHFFAGGGKPNDYFAHLSQRYGEPSDVEDFCRKAQLLNVEAMKAMFEGWLDHSDTDSSGMIIWMSHPAYPVCVWQTYDYYNDTTGAYWGAKSACEPVHIYWNINDDRIRVVNTSGKTLENLKADLWIYNADGTEKAHQSATLTSTPDKVAACFKLTPPADLSPTHFLKLRLTDAAGKVLSENFYWRGTEYLKFFSLSSLKPVKLKVSKSTAETLSDNLKRLKLEITNPADSGVVAFAIRPKLVRADNGEQVLPVFQNDSFFSLIPGETKAVTFDYHPADAGEGSPKVVVECWNNAQHPAPIYHPTPVPTPKPSPTPEKFPVVTNDAGAAKGNSPALTTTNANPTNAVPVPVN